MVELRNSLVLLKIASTHKYECSFSKSANHQVQSNTSHKKRGGMKEKRSKTSPFCRQVSPRDLHHYKLPGNRRKHKVKFFFRKEISKQSGVWKR